MARRPLPRTSRRPLLSSVPLPSTRPGACSAAFIALTVASLQGSEPTVVVIEYRGPSNESIAPLVVARQGHACADVQHIMAARRITLAPSQCPVVVTSGELAALSRSLKELRSDSVGLGSLQPGVLRATIFGSDSAVTEVRIASAHSEQALVGVERALPAEKYAEVGVRVTELRRRITSGAPQLQTLPLLTDCGANASGIDDAIQSRIVHDLTRIPPTWSVQTQLASSSEAHRLLELTSAERRVVVSVSYLAGVDDAARSLRCRLMMITIPEFRPVDGIGDAAFVLTKAHLIFRTGTMVFHVQSSDQSLDAELAIARRLIVSTRTSEVRW